MAYPQYGDVIGVHRYRGRHHIYDHYGVYESDDCVYEYAASGSDFASGPHLLLNLHAKNRIRKSTLRKFAGGSQSIFVLSFPEHCSIPKKIDVLLSSASGVIGNPLRGPELLDLIEALKTLAYHVYSPEKTIERARSRLGETKYSLALNNCEHFAIWCKTGISESHQVNAVLRLIAGSQPVSLL